MVDKGVPVRLVVYSVAIVYLLLDLLVFEGPLFQHFRKGSPTSPGQIEAAKAQGVVARVYAHPILLTQVDRRIEQDLWKEGRQMEDLSPDEKMLRRKVALSTLIDLFLLGRIKTHFHRDEYPVSDEEIDAAVARFASRFTNPEELKEAMEYQGWSETELRYRLAARMQQERYLDGLIERAVSEEEARGWFEENRDKLAFPERVHARHIFLATLNRDPEEAKGMLVAAQERLGQGARFDELARELSEDERTKRSGGDLGWLQAGRLPTDLAGPVFKLPLHKPTLVQSKIGWHLVEVLEKKEAEPRTFEDAQAEIVEALEARKRTEGLELYRMQLREFEKSKVEIYEEVLER